MPSWGRKLADSSGRRSRHVAVSALFAVGTLATLSPLQARAAACCLSATSFGVGRLLVWEDAALGLQLGHARILGEWTSHATLRRTPAEYSEGLSLLEPWGIVRIHERVQVQGWVPFLVNDRWSRGEHQIAGGLGDIGAAARFEVASVGELEGLPSFAMTVGIAAPTGRRIEQTGPPLLAGATGRGAWAGSLAVEAEYAFLPWFVRLDAGASAFLPFERSDTHQSQHYGPQLQAALSAGREWVPDKLVAALAVFGEWEAAIRLDGAAVPGSQAHLLSVMGSLAWRIEPHWTLVGTVNNTVWPDGLGRNRDARVGLNVGARFGYF